MHEHGLARELWPQLKQIAESKGLTRVTRLEMTVGMLHGGSGQSLVHSFQHAFEGTSFEGAEVEVTVVDPGQEFVPAGSDEPVQATGWELLVSRIEGE